MVRGEVEIAIGFEEGVKIAIRKYLFKISCVEFHSGSNLYTKAFQYRQLSNLVE